MDRKSLIILAVSFLLLIAWYPLVNRLYPPKPAPPEAVPIAATNSILPAAATPAVSNPPPPGPTAELTATAPATWLKPEAPEELMAVDSDGSHYVFTSHGGGLKEVQLKAHRQLVGSDRRHDRSNTNLATLNGSAPVPALTFLGSTVLQGDNQFTLTRTGAMVRAEKSFTNGLSITKEFTPGSNYLLEAVVRLENRGGQPLAIPHQEFVIGTATPISPRDRSVDMLGVIKFDGDKAERADERWFANRTLGCLPGTPRHEFMSRTNAVWGAVQNQFFALAVMPREPAPRLLARRVMLPAPTPEQRAEDSTLIAQPHGYQAALAYPEFTLDPGQAIERAFTVYAGPKEYNTLARLGHQLGNKLDLIMDYSGFFGFFSKALLLSMNGLHAVGLSYGISIIVITILIKLLFWPLTNASTRSMKRMAALQPQMKEIQEKYKEDPRKMNLKLMEFMKANKVSPMSGCFPMLLQIPVFIGFFYMLRSAIELRGATFLWAHDLSTADTIWTIPGLNFPVNPLPLLMGATMIWQARLTPPSPGMDPMQQKIMKYMPLMFMVFLYNFSAGLTLYWTVQNLLTIAQTKLTRTVDPHAIPGAAGAAPTAGGNRRKHKP